MVYHKILHIVLCAVPALNVTPAFVWLNPSPHAGRTVRPNKLKRQSLEQRKVYRRAMQGEQEARAQKT